MKEIKTFKLEVKETDEEGKFDGYASTFGNIDLGNDIIAKGAFAQTIKSNGALVPILDSHDHSKQIGWNETAKEDSKGLKVHGALDLNVQLGREKYSLMKTASALGAKMGLSIGYFTIKQEPHATKPEVRILKEVNLIEYSIVTFPMNPKASVTRVKSIEGIKVEDIKKHLIHELGISHKVASTACDMLVSCAPSDQIVFDQSEDEQVDLDYSPIGDSLKKLLKSFSI